MVMSLRTFVRYFASLSVCQCKIMLSELFFVVDLGMT
jgi:hypothetical protein